MPKTEYDIDYSYQKAISYSQYSMYKSCPHNWYLQYVKKHKKFENSIHLTFGTSIHEAIQHYMNIMYSISGAEADRIDLVSFFKERMIENYKEALLQNKEEHFVKPEVFKEFIEDGISILEYLKKKRSQYFSIKTDKLIGIEIPIAEKVVDNIPNVLMIGSLDLIFQDKNSKKYTIIDIKTSTSGWRDKEKKDQTKINQLLLYKHFYAKKLNVDPDMINVKFFIVKRKLFESKDFVIKRIQEFVPAQGKIKMKQAISDLESFVKDAFSEDAKYIDKEYPKNLDNCKWCPFKDNNELCKKS